MTIAMTQIDDVKSRLDIVELIGGYVNLQRSGSSLKANCPFHQERTPSFYVFPDRQSWRCFGACAEGGDAFSFVMKADRVDFRDALHQLAARVGITIVSQGDSGDRSRQLFEINDAARRFFQDMLATPEAEFVRDYLRDRGINERSLQTFEFGYSPASGNRLLAHLTGAGYTPEQIAEAELARATDDGRHYDFFRGRLMIPIRDWQARVAGFGSRALDDNATPKYLNTPRTPVFDKSRILFAMHIAKEPVRQQGAVIVEGYMDAIMAHQHGYDNVVASMGTALTEQQVDLVRRLTRQVTMALDGDPAGRNATLRSLESSWGVFQRRNVRQTGASVLQPPEAMELRVAELPAGQDPDDFIRQSPEAWPTFVEQAQELFDYLMVSLSVRADMESADGRAWVAQTMLRFVAQIPDRIRMDLYLDRLAARLSINGDTLRAAMPSIMRQSGSARAGQPPPATADEAVPAPSPEHDAIEESLLAVLLQHGSELTTDAVADISPEWFTRSENRAIYASVFASESTADLEMPPELEPHLSRLRSLELRLSNEKKLERAWQQIRLTIEKEYLNNEVKQLSSIEEEILEDSESPLALRLRDSTYRIGEIDRLLKPAGPTHL
ncbi:MAG: DNA primase [Chloroflexi bacterium]|nr:DNA primase [Chloroflexota bacterium]